MNHVITFLYKVIVQCSVSSECVHLLQNRLPKCIFSCLRRSAGPSSKKRSSLSSMARQGDEATIDGCGVLSPPLEADHLEPQQQPNRFCKNLKERSPFEVQKKSTHAIIDAHTCTQVRRANMGQLICQSIWAH